MEPDRANPEVPSPAEADTGDRGPRASWTTPAVSRFVTPALPAVNVRRPRLLQELDAAVRARVTSVTAPTGFGKSVLLAQWVTAHHRRRIAWLTASAEDNEPGRFDADIQSALDGAGIARQKASSYGRPSDAPFVLVIDDAHVVTNAEAFEHLAAFVEDTPSLHLVLVSRADSAFPIHRFRLRDQVVELRQRDLAFDDDEGRELLSRLGRQPLTAEQIHALLEHTEGWVTGIQLAALSLRAVDDVDGFVKTFAGDDRHVADFVTERLLELQDPDAHRFLLSTSVLRELSVPLCNYVLQSTSSGPMIDQLERAAIVLSSLDDRRVWFRYHSLVRTLLRQHLRAEDPDLERELLERAAEWHLLHDNIDEVLRYLVEARRLDRAVEVVAEHAPEPLAAGRANEVSRWLEILPRSVRVENPTMRFLDVAARVMTHSPSLAASSVDPIDELGPYAAGDPMAAEALRSIWELQRREPALALAAADRAIAHAREGTPRGSDGTLQIEGLRHGLAGAARFVRAIAIAELGDLQGASEALAPMFDEGVPFIDMVAHGLLGIIDALSGRLRLAARNADRAEAIAEDNGWSTHAMLSSAVVARAIIAREQGHFDDARTLLDRAAQLGRTTGYVAGMIETERAELALMTPFMTDEPPAAGPPSTTVEARQLLQQGRIDEAEALAGDAMSERVRVAVAKGDLDKAETLLEQWSPDGDDQRARLTRLLWAAVVADLRGDTQRAFDHLSTVIVEVEDEDQVGVFLDIGRPILPSTRALYQLHPTPFLRRLLDHPALAATREQRRGADMPEPLTDQELTVLGYLPTRLSNAAIAEQLGLSSNTIKTHLKHIYRKLRVSGRAEAVDIAERSGLL